MLYKARSRNTRVSSYLFSSYYFCLPSNIPYGLFLVVFWLLNWKESHFPSFVDQHSPTFVDRPNGTVLFRYSPMRIL